MSDGKRMLYNTFGFIGSIASGVTVLCFFSLCCHGSCLGWLVLVSVGCRLHFHSQKKCRRFLRNLNPDDFYAEAITLLQS